MKIILITDFKGIKTYNESYESFLACAKYAGRISSFIHEIQVDMDDVFIKQEIGNPVGHVTVKKKVEGQLI